MDIWNHQLIGELSKWMGSDVRFNKRRRKTKLKTEQNYASHAYEDHTVGKKCVLIIKNKSRFVTFSKTLSQLNEFFERTDELPELLPYLYQDSATGTEMFFPHSLFASSPLPRFNNMPSHAPPPSLYNTPSYASKCVKVILRIPYLRCVQVLVEPRAATISWFVERFFEWTFETIFVQITLLVRLASFLSIKMCSFKERSSRLHNSNQIS